MTTVINLRGSGLNGLYDALAKIPNFVYVGRHVGYTRTHFWPASEWANPFKVGMGTKEVLAHIDHLIRERRIDRDIIAVFDGATIDAKTSVELCRSYILASPTLRVRLPQLKDKVLGCWCGSWRPGEPEIDCHAVMLAKIVNQMSAATSEHVVHE
jgi:hypothetical protein